jgi:hypothetical protein
MTNISIVKSDNSVMAIWYGMHEIMWEIDPAATLYPLVGKKHRLAANCS